ncbi:GTP cyclohydrolase II [Cryptosporangium phraense]|uniref:GTP cyclohydrolase-2 n=1 Tax=Cryptosporangium phraense TaxID=2593070 RepID=A0A545AMU8_9ACTN|nr:GTP cyclohydrolase II [Cryptosporangium phraense]TQS42664.1 GTP cyclohydrolase II [Cryptosporangium phraense]
MTTTAPATVRVLARAKLPTRHGVFDAVCFSGSDDVEHLALSIRTPLGGTSLNGSPLGEPSDGERPGDGPLDDDPPIVRVHSECLTGEALGSQRCDCGPQLDSALRLVAETGRGMVLYLRGHEGRGIGLAQKIRAYALQEAGLDTVEANLELGEPVDRRSYGPAAAYLRQIGVDSIRLLTNNPDKVAALRAAGVQVAEVLPMPAAPVPANEAYLATKTERMGHRGLRLGDEGLS